MNSNYHHPSRYANIEMAKMSIVFDQFYNFKEYGMANRMVMICSIGGCEGKVHVRTFCVRHYQQWYRHGDPLHKERKSPICNVDGCLAKRKAGGMCGMHYQRNHNHGDPTITLITFGLTLEERFWNKVKKGKLRECWPWTAATDKDGYGIFGTESTTAAKAHRVAYQLKYGVDPGLLKVLHRCDNPPCVNPRHLYMGTPMDNMQDKIMRGRERYIRGEECHTAKLTAVQVQAIRKHHAEGMSSGLLANTFGVTRDNVYLIVKGKTWKHIQ